MLFLLRKNNPNFQIYNFLWFIKVLTTQLLGLLSNTIPKAKNIGVQFIFSKFGIFID